MRMGRSVAETPLGHQARRPGLPALLSRAVGRKAEVDGILARAELAERNRFEVALQRANDELAAHLGVGPFPVIDDGMRSQDAAWKAEAARPLVEEALAGGRPVVWIEDFCGRLPDLGGVTYVDTGERGVLRWSDVPVDVFG